MKHDRRLLFFGELLWDMVPTGAQPGGATANVAVMAQSCGANTLLVSALGKDDLGEDMIAQLQNNGLPTDGITISKQWPTSTVDITLTADGQPSYIIHTDVAWDNIVAQNSVLKAARTASAFYFGTLVQRSSTSRRNLQLLLDLLPADCLRFFDINLRLPLPSPEVVQFSLNHTDIFKLNADELETLAQWLNLPRDERAFAEGIFARFPLRTILLTKGAEGAVVFERGRPQPSRIPGIRIEHFVNSIGAGDAFSAGWIVASLRGDSPAQAAAFGSRLAVKVCQHNGAWLPAHAPASLYPIFENSTLVS